MKKTSVFKNPTFKNILSALAVALFGMILLNITFLIDALFQSAIDFIMRLFIETDVDMNIAWNWFPLLKHGLFFIIVGCISFVVFRSKISVLYKAIFMTVPVALVLATIGMLFYRIPGVVYLLGGIFSLGSLYYCYRTKQPWLYYYTIILIALVMFITTISRTEI